jgi:glutamine amidotransferase PdxT
LFINEENISKSPQIAIKFENKVAATAMLDSGSEVNLISQGKFDQRQEVGINVLTLPVQGINLVTAFGKRSKSIKLQLIIEFNIEGENFEAVFLVAPQLNCDVILGCNFLKEYGIQLF